MDRTLRLFVIVGLVLALAGAGYLVYKDSGGTQPHIISYNADGTQSGSKPVGGAGDGTTGGVREDTPTENAPLNPDGSPATSGSDGGTGSPDGSSGGTGSAGGNSGGTGSAGGSSGGPAGAPEVNVQPGAPIQGVESGGGDGTSGNGAPQPDANGNYPIPDVSNPAPGGATPGRTEPINPGGKSGGVGADAKGNVGAGSYTGGSDMATGVWRANPGCVYNLNGVQSPLQNSGQSLVEIRSGDTFSSQCGWQGGAGGSSQSVAYGWHIGGRDMPAGSWQPSGSECAFNLMSDLRSNSVIGGSEYYTSTRETVIIESGDILYSTSGCGTWSKIG